MRERERDREIERERKREREAIIFSVYPQHMKAQGRLIQMKPDKVPRGAAASVVLLAREFKRQLGNTRWI